MKRILFILFIFLSVKSIAQVGHGTPNLNPQSNVNTTTWFKGAVQSDIGFIDGIYADTTTANSAPQNIKRIPFVRIATITPYAEWYRDTVHSVWVLLSTGTNIPVTFQGSINNGNQINKNDSILGNNNYFMFLNTNFATGKSGISGTPFYLFDNPNGEFDLASSNSAGNTNISRMQLAGLTDTTSLTLFGSDINYLNFGSIHNNNGYGFRDSLGIMGYKDAAGNWIDFKDIALNGSPTIQDVLNNGNTQTRDDSIIGGSHSFTFSGQDSVIFNTPLAAVNGSLAIRDGTQASGYIWTSDADGNGSWQPSSTGGSPTYQATLINGSYLSQNNTRHYQGYNDTEDSIGFKQINVITGYAIGDENSNNFFTVSNTGISSRVISSDNLFPSWNTLTDGGWQIFHNNGTASDTTAIFSGTGAIRFKDLATGGGNQMVITDGLGNLSKQAIPAGTVTSVSGTTNRITSTGGTTPVIDISASYVGQSSITTLGTVATGVWQGTTIDTAYTNAVSKLTAGTNITLVPQGKGYQINASGGGGSNLYFTSGVIKLGDSTTVTGDTTLGKMQASKYQNARTYFLGDSYTYERLYQTYVKRYVGVDTTTSDGIPGSCITGGSISGIQSIVSRIDAALATDPKLIIIEGSTNDWFYGATLGTPSSTDTLTYYGALNYIGYKISKKTNGIRAFFVTMLMRGTDSTKYTAQKAYVDAMYYMAQKYSIPVIDEFNASGINYQNIGTFCGDNVHPNTPSGLYRYGLTMAQFMLSLTPSNCPLLASGAWNFSGGNVADSSVNYLGNTNNVPLIFKVNNQKAGEIDNGGNNRTYFGALAGLANTASTSGNANNGFGASALTTVTSGSSNVAVGNLALSSDTSGATNTAVGVEALKNNTNASSNTAVGYQAAKTSTTASGITAVGSGSLSANTGSNNTAIGTNSLLANTTGNQNFAGGYGSLTANQTGTQCTAAGFNSLAQSTASDNTAFGRTGGYSITSGSKNTFLGSLAGYSDGTISTTNVTNSTGIGYGAEVTQNNSMILGGLDAQGFAQRVGINTTAPSGWLDLPVSKFSAGFPSIKIDYPVITTTGASGTGSTAIITFASQSRQPFVVNDSITITGVTPSGYNGTYKVTAATSTSVSYSNSTTGSQTVAGNIVLTHTLASTPVSGNVERDGGNLYWTDSQAIRKKVVTINSGGSAATYGQATLSGGTVTVNTTAVKAGSIIQLTDATTGSLTNVGQPTVGTITAGTSFVINSTNPLDASNVNWTILP